jgi:hypothetical protein
VIDPTGTGRTADIVVASCRAPEYIRAQADFRCDLIDDHVQIQQAIDEVVASGPCAPWEGHRGEVFLTGGPFIIRDTIYLDRPGLRLRGDGRGSTTLLWNWAEGRTMICAPVAGVGWLRSGADPGDFALELRDTARVNPTAPGDAPAAELDPRSQWFAPGDLVLIAPGTFAEEVKSIAGVLAPNAAAVPAIEWPRITLRSALARALAHAPGTVGKRLLGVWSGLLASAALAGSTEIRVSPAPAGAAPGQRVVIGGDGAMESRTIRSVEGDRLVLEDPGLDRDRFAGEPVIVARVANGVPSFVAVEDMQLDAVADAAPCGARRGWAGAAHPVQGRLPSLELPPGSGAGALARRRARSCRSAARPPPRLTSPRPSPMSRP